MDAEQVSFEVIAEVVAANLNIGSCIYCGSTIDLTDEHVMPLGIGGKSKLLRGSCKTCARATAKLEDYVLRRLWKRPREATNMPSRNAKRSGRWTGREILTDRHGAKHDVPVWAAMPWIFLPYPSALPRQFAAEPPSNTFNIQVVNPTGGEFRVPSGIENPTISVKVEMEMFARFVAKVGYCQYVYRPQGPRPNSPITDFILKGEGDIANFLGADLTVADIDNRLHQVAHRSAQGADGISYDCVRLRFWNYLAEVPTYYVVIGPSL